MAANFNRTAGLCLGDWILSLAADDRLRPGSLAEIAGQVQQAASGSPVAAVVAAARRVYPDGRVLGDEHYGVFGRPLARLRSGRYDAADWLAKFPLTAEGNERLIVVNRDVVSSMGGFHSEGSDGNYGDIELAIKVAAFGDVLYVARPLIDITFAPGSTTSGWRDRNVRLSQPQTQLEASLKVALMTHSTRRTVTQREMRGINAAIAWSHLRRALRHRRDPSGGGWREALRDAERAVRTSPRTCLTPRGLMATLTVVVVPMSMLDRGRALITRALRRRRTSAIG